MAKRSRQAFAAVAVMGMAIALLGGCALYSATRDQQGKDAKEAWRRVDLKAQVEVPRQNLAKLLDEQLRIEEEIWRSRRTFLTGAIVSGWTLDQLAAQVDQGLLRVLGGAQAQEAFERAEALESELSRRRAAEVKLAAAASTIRVSGIEPPTCAIVLDPTLLAQFEEAARATTGAERFQAYRGASPSLADACRQLREQGQTAFEGELGAARKAMVEEQAAIDNDKGAADLQAARMRAALAEYQAAEREFSAKPADGRARIDEALAKLRTLASALAVAADPNGAAASAAPGTAFSNKLMAEERLASLNRFLSTYDDVTAGKGTPEGSSRAAIALALFPDLLKKSQDALAEANKPRLAPLVLQKNLEQARLEAAQRDVQRRETLLELRRVHVRHQADQAMAYLNAARGLRRLDKAALDSQAMREVLRAYDDESRDASAARTREAKQQTWKAVTRFLEAEGHLRAEASKAQYRITALEHEGVLTYAESSINQWKGLIDPSVDLLADWGASGVKASDITDLFDSLMLLGIAIGVN